MPVYIDSARIPRRRGRLFDHWSTLTASDPDQLHAFARRLGLRRSWALDAGDGSCYYEVTEANRLKALELGAQAVPAGQAGQTAPSEPATQQTLPLALPTPTVVDYAALLPTTTAPSALNYTAIDVETANGNRGSICQLGMVRIRDGRPAGQWQSLITPAAALGRFHWMNTRVHGLTAKTVAGAPGFADVSAEIADFIGADVLVAHNAGFEAAALTQAAQAAGVPTPGHSVLCTVEISRRALPGLEKYRLPVVLAALGYEVTNHHDALADARDAVRILDGCARVLGASDLAQIMHATRVAPKQLR